MPQVYKSLSPGNQEVIFSEILKTHGISIRISIKSDGHPFQSRATCEVFSKETSSWNPLAAIHHGVMKTPHKLHYMTDGKGLDKAHFQADRNDLVNVASEILAVPFV